MPGGECEIEKAEKGRLTIPESGSPESWISPPLH